jgi:hypothetical protein
MFVIDCFGVMPLKLNHSFEKTSSGTQKLVPSI